LTSMREDEEEVMATSAKHASTRTIEVLVIGTSPPCPRCDLLLRRVEEVAAGVAADSTLGFAISRRSCSEPEVVALGKKLHRRIGTPKEVAEVSGIPMQWHQITDLIARSKRAAGAKAAPADAWTPELDTLLEPCQNAADSVGYFMTPVLVVDREVKHHGRVPTKKQIRGWLGVR